MTCNLNQEELLEYLDNELPAQRRVEVETHLNTCTECRAVLDGLKDTDALWRTALCPHALTPSFQNSVRDRLSRATPGRRVLRWAIITSVAACLVLAFWAAIRHHPDDYPVPISVGTNSNEVVGSIDKQTTVITGPDQTLVKPLTPAVAYQSEKGQFHTLHTRNPMLSVFVRRVKSGNISDQVAINQAAQELVKLLQDSDDEVRASAAAALGELKATEAISELAKLLGDKYAGARGWAAIALAELGAKDKLVKEVMADIECIRDNSDETCQARIREALKALGAQEDKQKKQEK